MVSIRGIRDTVSWRYTGDMRKRFDALGREVCSRRRAPCQEADIAANETLRNVFVCVCARLCMWGATSSLPDS